MGKTITIDGEEVNIKDVDSIAAGGDRETSTSYYVYLKDESYYTVTEEVFHEVKKLLIDTN